MKLLTKEQYLKQNLYNSAFSNFMPLNEGEEVGLKDSIVGQLGSGLFNIGKYLVGKVDQRMKLGALRIKSIQFANIIKKSMDEALLTYDENNLKINKQEDEQSSNDEDQEEENNVIHAEDEKEDNGNNDEDIKINVGKFTDDMHKFIDIMNIIHKQPSKIKTLLNDLINICNSINKNIKRFQEFTEIYKLDSLPELKKCALLVDNISGLLGTKSYDNIISDKDFINLKVDKASNEMLDAYKKHQLSVPQTNSNNIQEDDTDIDNQNENYIVEGVITNLGDLLTSIDLSKYPKTKDFKDAATNLVDRRSLKLISYEAKLIIGGMKKDQDPLDNKLNTFWERQMLLIDKNYNDYVDMDDVRKNVDISSLSEKEKEEAELRVGVVSNIKKTAGHFIIKKIEGLNNVPLVLQVYDTNLKSKLYNIVCTSMGKKDGLYWFRLYNTYVYTNGKWIETDLFDKNVKERAGDNKAIFTMESITVSNKPKPLVLFNDKGMILTKVPKLYNDDIDNKIKTCKTLKQISNNYSYILPVNISALYKIDKEAITNYELTTTTFSSRIDNTTGFIKAQEYAKNTFNAINVALEKEE